MTNIPNLIAKLKEAMNNSTPVNSWYPHLNGKEIRGPYNRWFEVVGPKHPEISSHSGKVLRAEADKDILFFCEAVNSMPEIIQALETLKDFEYGQLPTWKTEYEACELVIETLQDRLETQSKVIEKMKEALKNAQKRMSHMAIHLEETIYESNFEDCQEVGMRPDEYLLQGSKAVSKSLKECEALEGGK